MALKPHRAVDLGTLTIPNGGTETESMDFSGWRGGAKSVGIAAPATLTGSVIVQVSEDDVTWYNKQHDGADIAVASGDHVTVPVMDFQYMRLFSNGAEGAERVFVIKGVEGES